MSAERLQAWRDDPRIWLLDVFGNRIREKSGLDTKTGLTKQQEEAFEHLRLLIRSKIKTWYIAHPLKGMVVEPLTAEEEYYSKKIGISIMSGQGSGKDFWAALALMYFQHAFPFPKITATANTGKQLKSVLWSEISKVMSLSLPIDKKAGSKTILETFFQWQTEKIIHRGIPSGERWFAEAVTINTKDSETAQAEALGGRHEDYQMILIDEATGIKPAVFKPLEGTLTRICNFILMIFNPTMNTGYAIDSQYKDRDQWIALRWNTEECELVSKQHIDFMRDKYGTDSDPYRMRVLGLPPSASTDTLVPMDWINDAQVLEIEPLETDMTVKSCDFASGGDLSIICTRKGGRVYPIKRNATKDTNELVTWVRDDFMSADADVLYGDANGLGAHVMSDLRKQLYGKQVISVLGQGKAMDENRFLNKRAEMFWNLRMAFQNRAISLPRDDDLVNELLMIRYKVENGKIRIIKKDVIKKDLGHSPDAADALAIGFAFNSIHRKPIQKPVDRYRRDFYASEYSQYEDKQWMLV